MVAASPLPDMLTHMDLSEITLLGRVDRGQSSTTEKTPAGKKKRPEEYSKPSKKKSSSKPTVDNLKSLDHKWAQRFARLEAVLLAKSFAVLVEPVQKPAEVVTSERPFFDPGAGTGQISTGGVSDVSVTQVLALFRPLGRLLSA